MRSRAVSLPAACCLAMRSSPPPLSAACLHLFESLQWIHVAPFDGHSAQTQPLVDVGCDARARRFVEVDGSTMRAPLGVLVFALADDFLDDATAAADRHADRPAGETRRPADRRAPRGLHVRSATPRHSHRCSGETIWCVHRDAKSRRVRASARVATCRTRTLDPAGAYFKYGKIRPATRRLSCSVSTRLVLSSLAVATLAVGMMLASCGPSSGAGHGGSGGTGGGGSGANGGGGSGANGGGGSGGTSGCSGLQCQQMDCRRRHARR